MIPEENVKDLADIPDEVKNKLEIIPVARIDDVLKVALVRMPDPIAWEEEPAVAPADDKPRAGRRRTECCSSSGPARPGTNSRRPGCCLRRPGFFMVRFRSSCCGELPGKPPFHGGFRSFLGLTPAPINRC